MSLHMYFAGILFVVSLVLNISMSKPVSDDCPASIPGTKVSSYTSYDNSCYYFSGPKRTATVLDAEKICKQGGGYLASIQSEAENNFVWDEMAGIYHLGEQSMWIGLKYDAAFGFAWDDGSEVSYNHIRPKVKAMKDRMVCVTMEGETGEWKTNECLYIQLQPQFGFPRLPFVCEFEG